MSTKPKRAPRVVVDTCVLIAGAAAFRQVPIEPKAESGALVFRWIRHRQFEWLYAEPILDEYKAVLNRFRVPSRMIGTFINRLRRRGTLVNVRKNPSISPDPGDDPFCACAEVGMANFIVTLNPRDSPQKLTNAKVIKPGALTFP